MLAGGRKTKQTASVAMVGERSWKDGPRQTLYATGTFRNKQPLRPVSLPYNTLAATLQRRDATE